MDINTDFVQTLPPDAKKWLAHAIAGMICADGVVDKSEMEYLREAINFLENVDEINVLVEIVKKKEKPVLQILKIDRKPAFQLLSHLARLSIVDGHLSQPEVEFLKYAGSRLGFSSDFCLEVGKWVHNYLGVVKMEKTLMSQAIKTPAVFRNI